MTKRVMTAPTPSPPGDPGGIALSDSEKAEVLADSLDSFSASDRSYDPDIY